jgi:hypothetical protein
VPFTIPRVAEKLPLLIEELNQLRPIGGPAGQVDTGGERYIADQERNQKQRVTNYREFQTAAMLRGAYYYIQNGDALLNSYTDGGGVKGSVKIDYQVPPGNTGRLNMTGAGPIITVIWSDSSATIVQDCLAINAAQQELTGRPVTDVWVTSNVWGWVILNTQVQNLAGSSNDPVQEQSRDLTSGDTTAILRAMPWLRWHITDTVLEVYDGNPQNPSDVDPAFAASAGWRNRKLIDDDAACFLPQMNSDIVHYYTCPEPVVLPGTNTMQNVTDEYYYHKFVDDPVSYEFHTRFSGLPVLLVPAAIVYAQVVDPGGTVATIRYNSGFSSLGSRVLDADSEDGGYPIA